MTALVVGGLAYVIERDLRAYSRSWDILAIRVERVRPTYVELADLHRVFVLGSSCFATPAEARAKVAERITRELRKLHARLDVLRAVDVDALPVRPLDRRAGT